MPFNKTSPITAILYMNISLSIYNGAPLYRPVVQWKFVYTVSLNTLFFPVSFPVCVRVLVTMDKKKTN